jgi:hypothetical protein
MWLRCSATEAKLNPQREHDVAFAGPFSSTSVFSEDLTSVDGVWGGDSGTGRSI